MNHERNREGSEAEDIAHELARMMVNPPQSVKEQMQKIEERVRQGLPPVTSGDVLMSRMTI